MAGGGQSKGITIGGRRTRMSKRAANKRFGTFTADKMFKRR